MKKAIVLLLLCALILMLFPAYADSLSDIRAQAGSFSANLNLPILLPQSDKVPVLRLRAGSQTPYISEPAAEYSQAVPGAYGIARNDPQWQGYGTQGIRLNLPRGWDFAFRKQDRPWDLSLAYPENNSLPLGEALAFIRQHAKDATGMDFDLNSLTIANSGQKGKATLMDFDILPPYSQGFYGLDLRQVINGWMVMDAVTRHLSERYQGSRPPWHFRASEARIASADSYFIGVSIWEQDLVQKEDLPLCPLETVMTTYTALMDKRLLHRPSELRLGYVLFADRDHPDSAIAYPCWLMKAEYSAPQNTAFVNLSVEQSPHYRQILVNAHTGELIGPELLRQADLLAPPH